MGTGIGFLEFPIPMIFDTSFLNLNGYPSRCSVDEFRVQSQIPSNLCMNFVILKKVKTSKFCFFYHHRLFNLDHQQVANDHKVA